MRQFIITIADGECEYPLNLAEDEWVDLSDYACRAITADQLDQIRDLSVSCPDYQTIAEILENGWELHIWKHKSH